jgi:diguanylate cyclase (GGDEF)-like protein
MDVKDVLDVAVAKGHAPTAKGREDEWMDNFHTHKFGTEEMEFDGDQHFRIVRSEGGNGECVVMRLNVTDAVRQRRAIETYAQQLENANTEITFQAFHDDLTGLGNRRYLTQKFKELSALRKENGGELAALHIDLDRFKQINDTMGHAAGDYVLGDVAARIRANVAGNGVIARIGGDEFVVLLRFTATSIQPECLADGLLKALSKPSLYNGRECRFAASIGIARTPLTDEAELLINSDVALYRAKRSGRAQVAIFDHDDLTEMKRTKYLADDIMRGLEAGEFIPYYQPQVDALSGQIVGLEALARWDHPKNGIMAPDSFLPIATDLNVVADIDKMIAETAIFECERGFRKLDHYPRLSFNVSVNRLHLDNIEDIRKLTQSYSGEIAFELLETIFLEEASDEFLMQLDTIRDMGITLEVDDFGSGRASIVALQRISPDQLKIDRRLVSPIEDGNSAVQLVKSIIDIGHALDIGVIAEGVETREQAQILATLGATLKLTASPGCAQAFLLRTVVPSHSLCALRHERLLGGACTRGFSCVLVI